MRGRAERKASLRIWTFPLLLLSELGNFLFIQKIPHSSYFPGAWRRELLLRKDRTHLLTDKGKSFLGKSFISLFPVFTAPAHRHLFSLCGWECTSSTALLSHFSGWCPSFPKESGLSFGVHTFSLLSERYYYFLSVIEVLSLSDTTVRKVV